MPAPHQATASASKRQLRSLWDTSQETEQLRHLLERVKTSELEIANAEAEESSWQASQLEALCAENQGLAEELDNAEAALETAKADLATSEAALNDAHAQASKLNESMSLAEERLASLTARLSSQEAANESLQMELRLAKDDHRAAADSAAQQGRLIAEMSADLEAARVSVAEAEQKITALEEQHCAASNAAAAEAEELMKRLAAAEQAAEERTAQADELLAAAEKARDEARRDADAANKAKSASESVAALAVHHAAEETRRKTQSLEASLAEAKDGLRAKEVDLAQTREELAEAIKALGESEEAARDLSELAATARELESRAFEKADAARVAYDEANARAAALADELAAVRAGGDESAVASALAASEEARAEAERAAAATATALAGAQGELAELRSAFANAGDELKEARAQAQQAKEVAAVAAAAAAAASAAVPSTPLATPKAARKSIDSIGPATRSGGVSKRKTPKASSLQTYVENAVNLHSSTKKKNKGASARKKPARNAPTSPLTDSDSDATPVVRRRQRGGGGKLGWSPVAGMILPGVSSLRSSTIAARRTGFGVGIARRGGRVRVAHDAADAEVARRARAAGVSVTALLGNRARRLARSEN